MAQLPFLCLALLVVSSMRAQAQSDAPFTGSSLDAAAGRALFERVWVTPPSSTAASDGLGPLYNARSCATCHIEGGRGPLAISLVMHFSGTSIYGRQLQLFAVPGEQAEAAALQVSHEPEQIYSDQRVLMQPRYEIKGWEHGSPDASTGMSPRIAPELSGIALLADISDEQLLALADPEDLNGDGISGRLPYHPELQSYGRFGWRSAGVSLADQSARALALDIGIGNPWYPSPAGDCTERQERCLTIASSTQSGESPEAAEVVITLLEEYLRALPVPETNDANNEEGRQLFHSVGCAACHTPFHTLPDSGKLIRPYTDLLLHHMGDALSDQTLTGEPGEGEWRTPPLWGMAERTQLDAEQQTWLHDGRAGSVEDAILWHGGEAEQARRSFQVLPATEQRTLLNFVEGL